MEKHILFLATTNDFLGKFEKENVRILQRMGYVVHYATNVNEPHYISDQKQLREMHVIVHPIDIARSPFMFRENQRALRQLLVLMQKYPYGHTLSYAGGRTAGTSSGEALPMRETPLSYIRHTDFLFIKEHRF